MTALLEIAGLKKRFPVGRGRELHAVDGVDLRLDAGESIGIVGESGSGKSTLARLAARLVDPSDGVVRFEGRDITSEPARRFAADPARRRIQLVFQHADDALNPAFSILRNIAIGLGRTRMSPEAIAAALEIAGKVGLAPELLERRPHQLSGGQQTRAVIARALISEPQVLVLDEPTASLDVSVQAGVLRLIDGIRRERGIALLFVSHDLEVVRLMCSRVLVLYLGRVAETGPAEEILARPRHPYTRALIEATPGRGIAAPLPGEASSPIDPDPGACLFQNRCPLAVERCRIERPMLRLVDGRHVACHRAEEPPPVAVSAPAVYSPR